MSKCKHLWSKPHGPQDWCLNCGKERVKILETQKRRLQAKIRELQAIIDHVGDLCLICFRREHVHVVFKDGRKCPLCEAIKEKEGKS